MKRILIFILTIILAAGLLAGCQGPADPDKDSKSSIPESTGETFPVPTGIAGKGRIQKICLFHDGKLFSACGYMYSRPEDAELLDQIRTLDPDQIPDEEMEASLLYVGMNVYSRKAGKQLLVEYDPEHFLKMEIYEGDLEDLMIAENPATYKARPRSYFDLDQNQLFEIGVYPNEDRDQVIDRILSEYPRLGIVYDTLTDKAFMLYSESEVPAGDSSMAWMNMLIDIDGVLSVSRPEEEFPNERISKFLPGPEELPAGSITENAPAFGWSEFKTLREAEEHAGFTFEIPENDLDQVYRTYIDGKMKIIEVLYLQKGKEVYRIRKSTGLNNPSGDTKHTNLYKKFDSQKGGLATYFWNFEGRENFYTAYRAYTDYSYSVTSAKGMKEEEMMALFTDDKHTHPEEEDYPNSRAETEYLPENWEKRQQEEPGIDIARLPFWELEPERVFTIALYPDADRDVVIYRILKKYNVVVLLEYLAEKGFGIYTKDLLTDEEAWALLIELSQESGVYSVSRPQTGIGGPTGKNNQTFPGQKISYYKTGPEMMPAGGWDPNDPENAGKTNPWKEHKTLQEAEKAVGFTFEIPENDLQKIYRTMGKDILEVIFLENGEEVYRLRKGVGYGNISGDNRKFGNKGLSTLGVDSSIMTGYASLSEDVGDIYRLIYRAYTDYSYSVSSVKAMTGKEMLKLLPDDKHTRSEAEDHPNSKAWEWYYENYKEGVPIFKGNEAPPEEEMKKPELDFPGQGDSGQHFSPDTLTIKLDPKYEKQTVIDVLLRKFPIELKYEFRLDSNLIAVTTKEVLSDKAFEALAREIYAMKGVVSLSRDMMNQPDNAPLETGVVDI